MTDWDDDRDHPLSCHWRPVAPDAYQTLDLPVARSKAAATAQTLGGNGTGVATFLVTLAPGGRLSNKTALAMIFKLAQAAEKSWHRLRGHSQLPKVILGVKFTDGIEVVRLQAQTAAA